MKIARKTSVLLIFLAFICTSLVIASLFLRSESGRQWAQREVLDWFQREYGVSIAFQSLEFTPSSFGWDLRFRSILWKFLPGSLPGVQEGSGQSIDELQLSINPLNLFLQIQPIRKVVIKGLILQPEIRPEGLLFRGAGLLVNQSQLAEWLQSRSSPRDLSAWPEIRLEATLVEWKFLATDAVHPTQGAMSVNVAGQWSPKTGLRQLQLLSSRINIAPLVQAGLQLFSEPRPPALASAIAYVSRLDRGWIEDLKIECKQEFDCLGSANLRQWRWQEHGFIPGVNDFSARLEFGRQQLEITIPYAERRLVWSRVYAGPLAVNLFGTRTKITYENNTIVLDIPKTQGIWNRLPFEADAHVIIPTKDPKKTRMQLNVSAPPARWDQIRSVLPDRILGAGPMEWLRQRLHKGQIHHLSAKLQGMLLEFPLTIDAGFTGLQLAYLDDWPELKDCRGQFTMSHTKISVEPINCQSGKLRFDHGKMEIPDIGAAHPNLQLSLEAQGSLEASLQFLQKTPLQSINPVIEWLGVRAPAQKTKITLAVPLGPTNPGQTLDLQGQTTIPTVSLVLPREILQGTLHDLVLQFDQNGVKDLIADLKQAGTESRLTLRRDASRSHLDLSLKPSVPAAGLEAALRFSPPNRPRHIAGHLSGLILENGAAQLSVDSFQWEGMENPLHVKGQAIVQDFGAISPVLGLGSDYKGGHGIINFDLTLPGNLAVESPSVLSGSLDFDLKDGSIEKLSPTSMALINVANLKILGINSKSLVYPYLKGSLLLDRGTLATDNATIGLGALEIQAKGRIDYRHDSLNFELTMIPDLGSPAASLAIGMWNPLVGLSLYGYSKFHSRASDSRLNRLASQSYRMKGQISKPEISLISILHLKEIVPWTQSTDTKEAPQ